jgi:murein DD-endopeptidase MepM/ murein hydrolase activator NlpD
VLDERVFRPVHCASSPVHFSPSLSKIQTCDRPTFHDIIGRLVSSQGSVDHTYYLSFESPYSFDMQPVAYVRVPGYTPWDTAQMPLVGTQKNDAGYEVMLFAQKTARSVGGRASATASRTKVAKAAAAKLWFDRSKGSKKNVTGRKKQLGKAARNKKNVKALGAALYARNKGKRARERSIPPTKFLSLTHLKPIAPNALIKPQKFHDAWRKKRKHPILTWPLDPVQFWVSSPFGPRKKPNGSWALHAGVDLAATRGTPVRAAREGRVIKATYSSGYGNYILIEHNKKYQTRYAHLDKILVREGQSVCTGDCIGKVGSTGFVRKSRWGSSGSHLHFEVYVYGKPKDPFYFLA